MKISVKLSARVGAFAILAMILFSCLGTPSGGDLTEDGAGEQKAASGRLGSFKSGSVYHVDVDRYSGFFCVDTVSGKQFKGRLYDEGQFPVADSHPVTVQKKRRRISAESDGFKETFRARDIELIPYQEGEFKVTDTAIFRQQTHKVKEKDDIRYGSAQGYWTSLKGVEADVSKAITQGYLKSFKRHKLDLTLDLYRPADISEPAPLIVFIHGGAFYVGDKKEPAYVDFCKYFSSLGYVTASINYRLGFHVGKGVIERAAYMALQDAHAALRFLVAHADEYGIDTERIFVAGSSAGSITALNLAFMRDEDRPQSSQGGTGIIGKSDLGGIASSGNDLDNTFHIVALANMWGAVSSLKMLENGNTDIISFHGDADKVVPYDYGYPFESAGEVVAKTLSDPMFGSVSIDGEAKNLGLRTEFHTFEGLGHALNTTGKDKQPNEHHSFIKGKIRSFFFKEMVPREAHIIQDGAGWYHVAPETATGVQWRCEGGFILRQEDNSLLVLWQGDASRRMLEATGTYGRGIGFICRKTVE